MQWFTNDTDVSTFFVKWTNRQYTSLNVWACNQSFACNVLKILIWNLDFLHTPRTRESELVAIFLNFQIMVQGYVEIRLKTYNVWNSHFKEIISKRYDNSVTECNRWTSDPEASYRRVI